MYEAEIKANQMSIGSTARDIAMLSAGTMPELSEKIATLCYAFAAKQGFKEHTLLIRISEFD